MHTWVDGWDWVWMTFMMGFWVVVVGGVVFAAVRLAQRPAELRTDAARRHGNGDAT